MQGMFGNICSGLMQVRRAFRGDVLIYGRLWLRRPLLCVFVSPSPLFGVCVPVVLFYRRFGLCRSSGRLWFRRSLL